MKKYSFVVITLLSLILAAGCGPDEAPASEGSLQVWIDAPLDESTLPLEPYEIVAHASDSLPVTSLEIQVNGVQLANLPNSEPEDLLALFRQEWVPPAPGEYEIQVKAQNAAGSWSETALVRVRVESQVKEAVVMEPAASETSEPTSCLPALSANENATCRSGPTAFHTPLGYLLAGEEVPISGRNQDWSWWSVLLPDLDAPCWIADSIASALCVPEDLAYLESPPYITRIGKSAPEFYWADNPNKTITIKAQAGGESPLSQLRVVYHIQGRDNWTSTVMANVSGDLWEGVIYARNLKGYEDYRSAIVEYYLEATSQNGLSSQSEMLTDIKLKKTP